MVAKEMNIRLEKPGTYVVAVSGGVDSMALLNLLSNTVGPSHKLIVAHLDHGIRTDSKEDRLLVEKTSKDLGLSFIYKEAHLGPDSSEATARQARYKFLDSVKLDNQAVAIVTAHHKDDLIETAIINILRGTGRKGLTSLSSQPEKLRPLLSYSKADIIRYAKEQNLTWREDSTNADTTYLRNYIRLKLLPRLDDSAKSKLFEIINNAAGFNKELDQMLHLLLEENAKDNQIDRQWFIGLPHNLALEVMASYLRANNIRGFDSQTLEKLVVGAKVAERNRKFPIQKGYFLSINNNKLALTHSER
jgi:tRNA(Ile)-lysidine synthase